MPNDNAITRLLYAILSQKCLKDIDWNKVAHDPVLSQEITNGHAARMRYSRFKKQMDGTSATRRPRNPTKRKKVEKKLPKKKERKMSGEEKVKMEMMTETEVSTSGRSTVQGTPEPDSQPSQKIHDAIGLSVGGDSIPSPPRSIIKSELGTSTPQVPTPQSSSGNLTPFMPTPNPSSNSTPSHSFHSSTHLNGLDQMNMDIMSSFGIESHDQDFMHAGANPYDMGMGILGEQDPFVNGLWSSQQTGQMNEVEDDGVEVKTEPRWDEAYQRI
ncbi:hypothetical protein B7494_g8069 [Chlorociboria aeruginascens]|nr:hypothetical protein B7494_g8069 [Chlorociboria aeruginascens]